MPKSKQLSLISTTKVRKVTQKEAIEVITQPWLQRGWGFRHMFIGYSGSGKTNAMLVMNDYLKRRGIVCIATDQKSRQSKYDENVIKNEQYLPTVDARSCVIRGFALNHRIEDRIDYDELARRVFILGHKGLRCALVVDELSDAAAGAKSFTRQKGAKRLSWMDILYRQGRELGISLLMGTQLPQEIPRSAFSLSDTLAFFRQCGHESRYYCKEINILGEEEAAILTELEDYQMMIIRKGDDAHYVCTFDKIE